MNDEWMTPWYLYEYLNERFKFKTDPCTTDGNPLGTEIFYTKETDGLDHAWYGPIYMNPPYSRNQIGKWVERAYWEGQSGHIVVGLLRRDSSTKWWNDWVRGKSWVYDVPFRVKFVNAESAYNFPSVIVVWHGLEGLKGERK